jgi:hypothetical protein
MTRCCWLQVADFDQGVVSQLNRLPEERVLTALNIVQHHTRDLHRGNMAKFITAKLMAGVFVLLVQGDCCP